MMSFSRKAALALAFAALVLPSAAKASRLPKPANIDRNGVIILIRSALLALDQANKTGNYTVLRDLGAPGFQVGNNAARLAEIFAKLRNDRLDLSGVAAIDPQLSLLPQIEANGMMHMAGFFPSVPAQVNFELFTRRWRDSGACSVSRCRSGNPPPAAPEAPAPFRGQAAAARHRAEAAASRSAQTAAEAVDHASPISRR